MALTFFETGFEFRAYKIGCLCLLELYTWRTNISEFVFISHKTFIYAIFLWEIRKLCSGNFCLFLSGLVFIFADGQSCNHASKYSKKCTFASFWVLKNAKNRVFHFPKGTSLATFLHRNTVFLFPHIRPAVIIILCMRVLLENTAFPLYKVIIIADIIRVAGIIWGRALYEKIR